MAPFYGWGSTASRLVPLRGGSVLFTIKFQIFLVLILSTSEGWKAESTLEPPSGFKHENPGLDIQRLNHWAIAPLLRRLIWAEMPENTLGDSDPIFYNLWYLPKQLVSHYIWVFFGCRQTLVKEASVWKALF